MLKKQNKKENMRILNSFLLNELLLHCKPLMDRRGIINRGFCGPLFGNYHYIFGKVFLTKASQNWSQKDN